LDLANEMKWSLAQVRAMTFEELLTWRVYLGVVDRERKEREKARG
jgi:hypothetical protein